MVGRSEEDKGELETVSLTKWQEKMSSWLVQSSVSVVWLCPGGGTGVARVMSRHLGSMMHHAYQHSQVIQIMPMVTPAAWESKSLKTIHKVLIGWWKT